MDLFKKRNYSKGQAVSVQFKNIFGDSIQIKVLLILLYFDFGLKNPFGNIVYKLIGNLKPGFPIESRIY
tara:strand:+ start:446 stop:652 length:207 start_codon:yes stop_codon:yes gene_type:complete